MNNKILKKIDDFLCEIRMPISYRNLIIKKVYGEELTNFLTKENNESLIDNFILKYDYDQPLIYNLGFDYFMNNKFIINENVLIPRVETEDVVLIAIEKIKINFPTNKKIKILDLCCGSGIIGISLFENLKEYNIELFCSDISLEAVKVCQKNLNNHKINAKIFISDCFDNIDEESFDVIIANPPYINPNTKLDDLVLKEPHIALFAKNNGYAVYDKILNDIFKFKPKLIVFEIGDGQYQYLNQKLPFELHYDQFGRERCLVWSENEN